MTRLLIIIMFIGLFFRTYQFRERFNYNHDNDLSAWIVKDIVVDHHFRLIGQQTTALGIFIGPLFYYALIPFYLITRMDPIGTVAFPWIIGTASIFSIYFVVNKIWGHRPALIAALFYAASFGISATEREIVPTTAVFLWSIWYLYALHRRSLTLLAVLFALVWHIHLALGILALPAIFITLRKPKLKPSIIFLALSAPLIFFEFRHGFIQTKALFFSFDKTEQVSRPIPQKVMHVIEYAGKNINYIFWNKPNSVNFWVLPSLILLAFFFLTYKKVLNREQTLIFISWFALFILFFSLHPINLSEYYINSLNILFIIIASLIITIKPFSHIAILVLTLFILHNLNRLISFPVNRSGYIERKAIVAAISADAKAHNYPCVSLSYMTNPGYEFGYRYLFWLANVKTAPVAGLAPVYTIVFPHPRANRLDAAFGALGLVLPDYSRYTSEGVKISCSGQNSNLTDPMFGFTN